MKQEIDSALKLRDMIGADLINQGGQIVDFGCDLTTETAELVMQSPAGIRFEITVRVLP